MRKTALVGYLSLPAAITLIRLSFALRHEPWGAEVFLSVVVVPFFFYAAPHLLWLLIAALANLSGAVWHAGFVGCSIALAGIVVLSFFVHDPSGLPIQWVLYWPLAIFLGVVSVGRAIVYRRIA